ncbi:TIGR02206 family membrane protein [Nocardioides insulae]|uniref:YwaF family protein n=1 Tax=Nocardioides insulae TaxID=394734 RepID=UPI0003FFBD10|nr:TIGR02206 family membrane protein [Nocardioides insulae]
MESFQAYGVAHWSMLVLLGLGLVPAVLLGRWDRDRRIGRILAVLIPVFVLVSQGLLLIRHDYHLETVLPLQLCDLAWMAAAWALWTRDRFPAALTYYWGLALTTQAALTPALEQPFPHAGFVAFWGQHLLVVWAAVHLVWGVRLRPTWWWYRATVVATGAWLIVVFVVNAALGTNYGFVNEKPGTGSVLDLLGPWPVYVLVEIVVIAAVWALMTWPWTRTAAARSSPHAA